VTTFLLALAAAILFGVSGITAKRGLAHADAHTGSLVLLATVVGIYLLCSPFWMQSSDWFSAGFWVFVLNGFLHPMLSMYFALEAHARANPTVAATFTSTAPLFAAITAILFLGEDINLIIGVGTLLTVAGVMTLSWSPQGVTKLMRITLLFASGAALIRGLNHTVGKWGLNLLPNVFMAGFVSFSVALIGGLILYRMRHGRMPASVPKLGLHYLMATGALIAVAIVCMYGALGLGKVVVVSPVVASYPVFTLLTALLIGQERLSGKLAAGVMLVVGGVAAISLSNSF